LIGDKQVHWFYLAIAITGEVIATTALKESLGFTKLIPSILVILGYSIAFYFLAISLKYIPIGISYAIWSGFGIILISIIGFYRFNQKLDAASITCLIFIIIGTIIINFFLALQNYKLNKLQPI
tara:strand:+ start:406 stop:777 length:372 start_codon:yes stop_codon:yes gene_type:complete